MTEYISRVKVSVKQNWNNLATASPTVSNFSTKITVSLHIYWSYWTSSLTVTNLKLTTTNWPALTRPVIVCHFGDRQCPPIVSWQPTSARSIVLACRSTMLTDNEGPCGATLNGTNIRIAGFNISLVSPCNAPGAKNLGTLAAASSAWCLIRPCS